MKKAVRYIKEPRYNEVYFFGEDNKLIRIAKKYERDTIREMRRIDNENAKG